MPWWSRELFVQGRSPGDGLEADWREVRPEDGNFNARLPRFYLFALKAYCISANEIGSPRRRP
jgi:hypothetical protein